MDLGSLLLGLALLVVVAFIVARPLIEKTALPARPAGPGGQLLIDRERVLIQLRDWDFDQATGKINDDDYAAQRSQLVAEGVAILKQLDALGLGADQPADTSAAAPADDIEAAVAQLRARRSASARATSPTIDSDTHIEAVVAERRAASANAPAGAATLAAIHLACAQCGAAVQSADGFCPKCGLALTVTCGNCGQASRAGDQFCAHCGQSLPAPAGGLRQAKVQG